MRVLLIHQYFLEPDDGGGSRFNEMTKQWTDLGHEVTVIAGMMHANGKGKRKEYKGKYFVNKKAGDIELLRCHVSESYNNGFLGRLWGYFSFVFSSIYGGLFKTKKKYDIILVTSPPLFLGITAYVLSKIKRIPFVFEVRDLWPESAIDTGVVTNKWIIKFSYWFESFIYRKASLINVLTPAFEKKLIETKGIPQEKIIYIPNAADFTLSNQILDSNFDVIEFRNSLNWNDKKVILYVGAHGVANHLIQALEAAHRVEQLYPQLHFVFIGDGMLKTSLIEKARDWNLKNVEFIDPVSKAEVFKYILASDMGASILKKVDTFKTIYSNKTFDYMSCKKPILLAIDGVSRELVETSQSGIYIEPEDIDDWIKKLKVVNDLNKDELSVMGENGYVYANNHFDRIELGKKYIRLIEENFKKE